jgi:hypothetical protein
MQYEVTLVGGNKRTFEEEPEVGMAGELICQKYVEELGENSTTVFPVSVIFAPHSWRVVEGVANGGGKR